MSEQFIGGFTQGAAAQIAATVRRVRNDPRRGQRTTGQQAAQPYQVRPVKLRVTSVTQTNGYYPCIVQQFYSGTNVYSDIGTLGVWLFTTATHAVNDTVWGFCAGVYSGVPVYEELTAVGAGRLLNRQVFTTTGANTYTPTVGTTHIVIELVGGGGGSGGCSAVGNAGATGGGGGGQYVLYYTGITAGTGVVTIGAGGIAGTNAGTSGGSGQSTAFRGVGVATSLAAIGGSGSTGNSGLGIPGFLAGGAGGSGHSTVIGDIQDDGGDGGPGITVSASLVFGGQGGDAGGQFSGGGTCPGGVSAPGSNSQGAAGKQYGGGASGSAVGNTGFAIAGAAGAQGVGVVWEYS